MSSVYQTRLSASEFDLYSSKMFKHTDTSLTCHIWKSTIDRHGYPKLNITYRNKRKWVFAHRFNFFLHNQGKTMKGLHVSHLCHNKICVNIHHLSLEPTVINSSRNICKAEGFCCRSHKRYPACIL